MSLFSSLFSDEARRNPFPAYAERRRASPVLHDPATDLWILFDHDSVKRALTDHDAFSSVVSPKGTTVAEWMVFADPPRHTLLRALVQKAFTPRAVAGLEPRIRALSRELLAPSVARGEIDLVTDYAVPLPLRVIAEMLGAPSHDLPSFQRWSEVVMRLGYTVAGGDEAARMHRDFAEVTAEMEAYLAALLVARRAAPAEDLLTRLLDAEVDGERLTTREILGFFQLLLVAGHETTTNLISNAVLCLLESPGEHARIRAAPELLPAAIEEVLRYRSPVQAMFRVTRRDVPLTGAIVPSGKTVLTMIGAANRDPLRFLDAERFDVTRDPNPHVAFGHGIHACIGAPLARLEARVALGDLLELDGLARASAAPWEPRRAMHVLGPTLLPVCFQPR